MDRSLYIMPIYSVVMQLAGYIQFQLLNLKYILAWILNTVTAYTLWSHLEHKHWFIKVDSQINTPFLVQKKIEYSKNGNESPNNILVLVSIVFRFQKVRFVDLCFAPAHRTKIPSNVPKVKNVGLCSFVFWVFFIYWHIYYCVIYWHSKLIFRKIYSFFW